MRCVAKSEKRQQRVKGSRRNGQAIGKKLEFKEEEVEISEAKKIEM